MSFSVTPFGVVKAGAQAYDPRLHYALHRWSTSGRSLNSKGVAPSLRESLLNYYGGRSAQRAGVDDLDAMEALLKLDELNDWKDPVKPQKPDLAAYKQLVGNKPVSGFEDVDKDMRNWLKETSKEARCWEGYEPVPGKAPYSEDSCRPKGSGKKKKQVTKKADNKNVDWRPIALAGLLPPTIGLAGHSLLHPILSKVWPHKSKEDKRRSYVLGGAMAAGAGTLNGLLDAMREYRMQTTQKYAAADPCQVALNKLQLLLTKHGFDKHAEGGAWTRAEGKSESGGLNAKGRASLKAQGQNIKPPVTESNPTGERKDRKSSFCARMGGMKKKLTSSETANDPDSRINKALRKWKC